MELSAAVGARWVETRIFQRKPRAAPRERDAAVGGGEVSPQAGVPGGDIAPLAWVSSGIRVCLPDDSDDRGSNNASESAIRIVALLRKNALFVSHDEGGRHLAILLSLCATCRLHDVNPEEWIADALIRVTERGSTVEELLPWNWKVGRGAKKRVPEKAAA